MHCETGKICYTSDKQAWRAYISMSHRKHIDGQAAVYRCPFCKKKHLTSKRDERPYWVLQRMRRLEQVPREQPDFDKWRKMHYVIAKVGEENSRARQGIMSRIRDWFNAMSL